MKISANYSELSSLLFDKTGKQVELYYGENVNSVIVKYMNIPCNVYIDKVELDSVTLSYQIGDDSAEIIVDPCPSPLSFIGGLFKRGAQKLGNKAADMIIDNFMKHPAVSSVAERTLKIDLSKIPQMNAALEFADIENISVNESGVTVDFYLKKLNRDE